MAEERQDDAPATDTPPAAPKRWKPVSADASTAAPAPEPAPAPTWAPDPKAGDLHVSARGLSRTAKTNDPLAAKTGRLDVIYRARYAELARRLLQGHAKPRDLARDMGISSQQLRRYLRDPDFIEIYREAEEQLYRSPEGVDSLIRDEKASVTLRRRALHTRAMTLLGEVMTSAQAHIDDAERETGSKGSAKSAHLRAGIDAAIAAMDRSGEDEATARNTGQQHLHLHLTPQQAGVMRDTMAEAEIDISDVLPGPGSAPDIEIDATPAEKEPADAPMREPDTKPRRSGDDDHLSPGRRDPEHAVPPGPGDSHPRDGRRRPANASRHETQHAPEEGPSS